MALNDHAKGLLLTATGVLVLTPDSLLIRLVEADPWTLAFWRGLLLFGGLACGLTLVYRSRVLAQYRAIGRKGLVVALFFSICTLGFINALEYTTVANTLVIVAAAPLFAALYSWLFLRESAPLRTWIAILATLAGIGVLVSDSQAQGTLKGDLCALVTAMSLAATFTMIRHGRGVSMIPATGLSGLLTAAIALPLAAPGTVTAEGWPPLLIMGLVMLPVTTSLITTGPRYLPSAEVSLLMLLETVLGPFWVWLVLHEEPGERALLGGFIVLVTLVLHALFGLRASRARARAARTVPARP